MPTKQPSVNFAFIQVTSLFFAWGFITSTIDPLIPSVRAVFDLSYTQAMLTQFAFFMAYGVASLPAAALVARLGYAHSIVIALVTMVAGCLIMPLAARFHQYGFVLLALFVIAVGITSLQVAANPLAAALGRPQGAHLRLTLSQAFNSLGTVIGPYLGALVMLSGGVFAVQSHKGQVETLGSISGAFMAIAGLIALLALLMWRVGPRITKAAPPVAVGGSPLAALSSRWAVFGALAIFLYVGAEVSIGSIMINFLERGDILAISAADAGRLLSLYWLGAMVGRFIGSGLMARLPATGLLTVAAGLAALLCLTVSGTTGTVAAVAAISIGLFNSIMFPTIFTLTLERSTAPVAATSGLLVTAIVGGAVLPLVTGLTADAVGIHSAFLVPMAAYLVILGFAVAASRTKAAVAVAAPLLH